MSKEFKDMTKTELQKVAELYKVEDQVVALAIEEAKEAGKAVPKVPTNDTYINVLEAYKADREERVDESEKKAPGKIGNAFSSSGDTMIAVKKRYASSKVACIVTDHDNTVSQEEEVEGMTIPVRWGNKQGKFVDTIALHGKMQYVRQGAIDSIQSIKIPTNLKGSSERTKNRFTVTIVEGWSQDDIDAKTAEQKLKRAV